MLPSIGAGAGAWARASPTAPIAITTRPRKRTRTNGSMASPPLHATSGGERRLEVSGELCEERVGLLLDDGLTELSDLAEHGEVGLDLQTRPPLARSQREAHAGSDPSA